MSLRLNFACGASRWPGFDNSDINGEPGVRHVDLEQFPYPYDDESAELVMISHAFWMTSDGVTPVHPDVRPILAEFHRILEPGGWLRIDDNPWRCPNGDGAPPPRLEQRAAFPAEQRLPRGDLHAILRDTGFATVSEVPTSETTIPCDGRTRAAIVGNHRGHVSFTIEARK